MKAIPALTVMAAALLTGCAIPVATTAKASSARTPTSGAPLGSRPAVAAITACVSNHHSFTHASLGRPRPCPPQMPGVVTRAGESEPQPVPVAKRQTLAKRRTVADLGSTSWKCVTSNRMGRCSFGVRRLITGASSDPMVDQNVWNPITGWHQTLYANGPGHWKAVANMPAGNTAVVSYPNAWASYSGTVDSYSRITSSFGENMNKTNGTRAWAGYDLWFNDWRNEVMIQHDFAPNSARCGTYVASATFGGSHGVPTQTWKLCRYGSEIIWQLPTNERSGSIAILGMSKWLERHGYLPSRSTWTAISHGFEICSTGGHREKFTVSNFSVIARRK